ncbi:MAG: hypothetical protein JW726_07705 [Anaerolineales bacterium]|nr:hypothetical protein [Anaerolineales bacterium]
MKRNLLALITSLAILSLAAAPFSVQASAGDDESTQEQALALEAERSPAPPAPPPAFQRAPEAVDDPLFVGVDDTTVPAYRINPATAAASPAFNGFQVWGAAYDHINTRILFNNGATLYEWPLGGAVNSLGTITDGISTQSMVGLAFYNGNLYGIKNIANEAVYEINLTTLVATVFIDYVDADYDFGGLAIDPSTGIFYATNDDITPHGSGVFRINPNGTATLIAPYPAAQTDIDGLAVDSNSIAYLVTDEPGFIYLLDLINVLYLTPIANPWATSEVFSAGAWILGPAITISKTVGTDPNLCAATEALMVLPGTEVTYCYSVENIGGITLAFHDLDDSEIGPILSAIPYALAPGASAFITETMTILTDTVNTATWTAYNSGGTNTVTATDTATVTVALPGIALKTTVGLDPNQCAATDALMVPPGTDVTYCYAVENTGNVALEMHDLDDSEIGTILSAFPYALAPGASAFITETVTILADSINTATWNATSGEYEATAADAASVTVEAPAITLVKTVGVTPGVCATSDAISVTPGTVVYYCYQLQNTGNVALSLHDLATAEASASFSGYSYALPPGSSFNSIAEGLVISATITADTTVSATWTAYNPGGASASASDSVSVTITTYRFHLPFLVRQP